MNGPLSRAELARDPVLLGIRPRQLDQMVREALAAGQLVEDGGRLAAIGGEEASGQNGAPTEARSRERPLRVVAIDFESVVRSIATKPYVERRPFQVAALRFGRDRDWVRERRSMSKFCVLPVPDGGIDWQITSVAKREQHTREAVDATEWLDELDAVLAGADVVVAYNGFELDFPLLDESREREGRGPLAGVHLVDGLLLALSLWPTPPNNHRLADMARRLELDLDGFVLHEALSDCRLLAAVLLAAARSLRHQVDPDLVALFLAACDDSAAWNLVADLARLDPGGRQFDQGEVAGLLGEQLEGRSIRRQRHGETPPAVPPLPGSVIGGDGRVDPHLLAEMIQGHDLERRAAQGQMADLVAAWLGAGHGGLVEAPTGTGKSLVLLAGALDWVRGDSERRAIIATHTKQLQSQLARDVQRLIDADLATLRETADLVKGASNRLSVRGLVLELADSTDSAIRHRHETRPEYRELLVYLAMRFATARTVSERWLARSVDPVDVPMIFGRTSRGMLASWLGTLSQRDQGEYAPDEAVAATLHTDRVAESLVGARVIIANHALLLAHREELGEIADGLAVFVDEAHELEGAATEALSSTFDYQALERIPREIRLFVSETDAHDAVGRLGEVGRQLQRYLESEVLPATTLRVLDALSEPGSEAGRRAVTLASSYAGRRGGAPIDGVRFGLARVRSYLDFMRRSLGWWAGDPDGLQAADRWAQERFRALASSVLAQQEAIEGIIADLDILLGPLRRRLVRVPGSGDEPEPGERVPDHEAALAAALDLEQVPDGEDGAGGPAGGPGAASPELVVGVEAFASGTDGVATERLAEEIAEEAERIEGDVDVGVDLEPDSETEDEDAEVAASEEVAPGDDASAPVMGDPVPGADGEPAPVMSNQVVWIAETESPDLARSKRRLRFTVSTSPVALGNSLAWREFIDDTPRLILTSGTLLVAGSWEFIKGRLGLDPDLPGETLESPFDFSTQACLVCLSDFPSWAEHPARAVRSVAHQVDGWMGLTSGVHEDGGMTGGAMVLTTSKATAAAISEAAAPLLSASVVPVATTETLGNARAVDQFVSQGGVIVGTRGLWQGVDIADPDRIRLVWINKLPFASFADPVIAARRAAATEAARLRGEGDPDRAADEAYYLPLAALGLRQAVGRLIRSTAHRGVIVISDSKLAGNDARRRMYRRVFLGSLEKGLVEDVGGDTGAANVLPMTRAWAKAIAFGVDSGFIDGDQVAEVLKPDRLAEFVDLPEMTLIRSHLLDEEAERELRAMGDDALGADVVARSEAVAQALGGPAVHLHPEQRQAIDAIARGQDLMALLPTGFGKSFCYQLPGLVLPGVTIVVSPLVSLMVDQAMGLGATIGSMVRALTGPMRESNSRMGKTQVAEQLRGEKDHGIRLVYLSPERLSDARFRQIVEEGVSQGVVRRIAIDEAHTLVDWGDDFRPSFRRLDRWLAGIKATYPDLQVSAFTATANQTVREGIRTRVFGLPAVATGPEPELALVEATPLRPELALWRRRLQPGGPNAVAGLVEAVVDALDCHAIFYCLTVREVERVYASLRDYLGDDKADRVLRYHGRLSQAEKAAVALSFRTAGRAGDEDFTPMIVAATSAFGLGVDRDDIRCVFCVSPPTDLAALYQQLGRAGRDSTHLLPGRDDVPLNAAMALVTQRAWRTVTWMASQDLSINTLRGLGDRFLAHRVGEYVAIDPTELAQGQVQEEVDAGQLPEEAIFWTRLADRYSSGAMRALAALGASGGLEDLGDVPDRVRITPGELPCDDELWGLVLALALAVPEGPTTGVELQALHDALAGTAGYADACPSVADLWIGLSAAHDWGWVDISQQVTQNRLVVYRVTAATRPAGFDHEVQARSARVAAELSRLRAWFDDDEHCAHQGFADAFGVGTLPPGTCAVASVRCSMHWNEPEVLVEDDSPTPALFQAFYKARPVPSAATAEGRANFERRLRRHISDLLWQEYRGLTTVMLRRVLHGEDSWFSPIQRRRRRLWPSLLYHRARGAMPGVRIRAVDTALTQLAGDGLVVDVGDGRWRWAEHVAQEAAKEAREAQRAAEASAAPAVGGSGVEAP
ncbi:MAG: DEAD/DEAH box helicase [Acidimicrobiales bacterium]